MSRLRFKVHAAIQMEKTVVVNDLPAEVCENCGEAYVAEDVTEQLLQRAAEARSAHAQVLLRPFAPAA